ncbi:MAG TPA: RNA methyltransferase [Usitatibacteraceae bacterium]|nr:RNA methyltransferase [Usitatibacteraceae bacterium]
MKTIASRDNAAYKSLARLCTSAAERRKRGLSVIEGAHLVEACLDAGHPVAQLFVSAAATGSAQATALRARAKAAEMVALSDALFDAVSGVESPAGILAVVPTPEGRAVPADARFCLALEDLQDPGNVGTLLRSAAAAGVEHVLLSPTCAFAWSPKVLRAGQGAHFALNIVEGTDLAAFVASFAGTTIALAGKAKRSLYETDLRGPVAFLVGNEGAGLSAELERSVTIRARIPMPGCAESLNAGVAGSIALFEAVRQRGVTLPKGGGHG